MSDSGVTPFRYDAINGRLTGMIAAHDELVEPTGMGAGGGRVEWHRLLANFSVMFMAGTWDMIDPAMMLPKPSWKDQCRELRVACGAIGAKKLHHDLLTFERRSDGASTWAMALEMQTLQNRAYRVAERIQAGWTSGEASPDKPG